MKKLLVARGFKRAKKFSWKKCAEKTYKVYEKILK
jgi:glycosyltransferase involved in cell wall biosynthesis